jgi:prepilin-type N-terminal cleavage/methylation domain-containing protein
MPSPRRPSRRAFTLVELMVVVVIVGVLATIGLVAFRQQIFGAKNVEVFAMIQSIRSAEERWKAENLTYLNVSTSGSTAANAVGGPWYPVDPTAIPGREKHRFFTAAAGHVDDARWKLLAPAEIGPVEFGYVVNAGGPAVAMAPQREAITGGFTWPTPTEPWYVIQAVGDIDDDGVKSFYMASSIKAEVFRQNDGE